MRYLLIGLLGVVICPVFAQNELYKLSYESEGLTAAMGWNSRRDTDSPGACGYVDKENNWVIPTRFSWAENFSEGLALVVLDAKTNRHKDCFSTTSSSEFHYNGDISFKVTSNCQYSWSISGGHLGYIDKIGHVLMELPWPVKGMEVEIPVNKIGSSHFLNSKKQYANFPPDFDDIDHWHFHQGWAIVYSPDGCHYLRKQPDGTIGYAFARSFADCRLFKHGFAAAAAQPNRWGFILQ